MILSQDEAVCHQVREGVGHPPLRGAAFQESGQASTGQRLMSTRESRQHRKVQSGAK